MFLEKHYINTFYKNNLEDIIYLSIDLALNENQQINIIFSPCASSFDQFKNFEHRGDFLKKSLIKD